MSSLQTCMIESLQLAFTYPPTDAQAIVALKFAGYRAFEITANLDQVLSKIRPAVIQVAA